MKLKKCIRNPLVMLIIDSIKYIKTRIKYPTLKMDYSSKINTTKISEYVTLGPRVDISKSKIGSYTYFASDDKFFNTSIGKFCSIGPGVRCGMGFHPSNTFVSTHPIFFSTNKQAQITFADKSYFTEVLPIEIGNDVWIGANVIILDGVRIGNGVILGAGAVVTKDIPDYAIAVGVPAKIIKYRFEKNQIDFLLKDKWWNKDIKWLAKNYRHFHDINDYIEKMKME